MSKRIQKQGKCIFCGGFGLSRQHVIPDWMSALLPYRENHPQQLFSIFSKFDPEEPVVAIKPVLDIKKRNGPVNQRKVRNVCVKCNGGWISQIESAAKPLFEAMILGKEVALSRSDSKLLSLSIAIMTIMWEYTDPNPRNRIIPDAHRSFIFKNRRLPDGWYIAVGVMDELCVARPRHLNFSRTEEAKTGEIISTRGYQVTTITLGYILIQAVTLVNFDYPIHFSREKLFRIYPFLTETTNWRENLKSETFQQFASFADSLPEAMQRYFFNKYANSTV